MAFYTICGKPDCRNFIHATYVAQYLNQHLPNFSYKKIEKSKNEWPDYVSNLNKKNGWFMVNSPIIWKEISTWGGKSYLIGGLSEFWEYCYCYYGLESKIAKQELEKLAQDNLTFFEEEVQKSTNRKYDVVVGLFAGDHQVSLVEQLLEDFLQIPHFNRTRGFFVKLYEERLEKESSKKLEQLVDQYNSLGTFGSREVAAIVTNPEDLFKNCDLLLYTQDFFRKEEMNSEIWAKTCLAKIELLADTISINAKRNLRVVFCNDGPSCLMATGLVQTCASLVPSNVVVLAAHRGLSTVDVVSRLTGIEVAKLGAPPVWGFLGTNEYVDESNMLFKADVLKPFKRALNAPEKSTLPLGTTVSELRLTSYLLQNRHEEIARTVEKRREDIEAKLNRKPILATVRAVKSLLSLWYSEEPSDQVVSLGVCSNGFFGIPCGLVFAQPCILDDKRRWKPFSRFPFVNETVLSKLAELKDEAIAEMQSVGLEVNNEEFLYIEGETESLMDLI